MKPVPEPVGGDIVLVKQQGAMRTGTNLQWNALYRSYLDLLSDDRSSMVFRLEDLLMSFGGTLGRSGTRWGLRRRHTRYVRPKRYLRAGIDGQSRFELLQSSTGVGISPIAI